MSTTDIRDMLVHLAAHSLARSRPLSNADVCWQLWRSLQAAIARVVAACLMPEHLHLIADVPQPDELKGQVAQILAAFARRFHGGPMWESVPAPQPIGGDPVKIARQVRYVYRNADRAGLVEHPASHVWSTYRDVLGATIDPWSSMTELAALLGHRAEGFVAWFRAYVEKGVDTAPIAADVGLDRILRAAEAAAATSRAPLRARRAFRRHAFVLAAIALGHRDADMLAQVLAITPDSVRRLARQPDTTLLRVTNAYLDDPRLLSAPRFRRLAA